MMLVNFVFLAGFKINIFIIFAFLFQIYLFTFFINWSITMLVQYIL